MSRIRLLTLCRPITLSRLSIVRARLIADYLDDEGSIEMCIFNIFVLRGRNGSSECVISTRV